jgi:hypothetical protein
MLSGVNTVSLHGTTDVLDIEDVLDLLQVSRASGCLRIEGSANGSLHVTGSAVLAVVVDGRPPADELARRSAAVLAVDLDERFPRLLAGLLGELLEGAERFSFVSGDDLEAGPGGAPLDLVRIRKELAVQRSANRGSSAVIAAGARLVRPDVLPPGAAEVTIDRLGWWVLGRCTTGATTDELAVEGGLTTDEVASSAARLLDIGILDVADEPAWLEVAAPGTLPAPTAPVPAWTDLPGVEPVAGPSAPIDDEHPGWTTLADAVLALPPAVVDIDELRQLRILDPAARDSRRERRRGRNVPVPT